MSISMFDLFPIGIGPSSSHTVGPMRAAHAFVNQLKNAQHLLTTTRIQIDVYGSLALTGKGHGTDHAILNGLENHLPETVTPADVAPRARQIVQQKSLRLAAEHSITFDEKSDFLFHTQHSLPKHSNGMQFYAYAGDKLLDSVTYYSIGGGFIVTDAEFGHESASTTPVPYPFRRADDLFNHCRQHDMTIAELMLANEKTWRTQLEIEQRLTRIYQAMHQSILRGCQTDGFLPGGLLVKRRAKSLYEKLLADGGVTPNTSKQQDKMNWLNLYAMAVNEENAAGERIVTAPTNGAAGIIPAVLEYHLNFDPQAKQADIHAFLLTAGAIAILYKTGASISGAEVGCQGEVGVACSMAAGALAAILGGTLAQIENAAEIAMEHHLGMTCDPVAGLVQIPCIERNAMGAVKAVNAARLALMEDAKHKKVTLDKVIATMHQTGKDMMTQYKETSLAGLAVNVTEC